MVEVECGGDRACRASNAGVCVVEVGNVAKGVSSGGTCGALRRFGSWLRRGCRHIPRQVGGFGFFSPSWIVGGAVMHSRIACFFNNCGREKEVVEGGPSVSQAPPYRKQGGEA